VTSSTTGATTEVAATVVSTATTGVFADLDFLTSLSFTEVVEATGTLAGALAVVVVVLEETRGILYTIYNASFLSILTQKYILHDDIYCGFKQFI
jgi:hypothetical protein